MNICRTCSRQNACKVSQPGDFCLNYDEKPQTNADRIRAMTDEELADAFDLLTRTKPDSKDDKKLWLDWLKSPVEADE